MRKTAILVLVPAILTLAEAAEPRPDPMEQWAQWRGPLATGVAPHGAPPATWSETRNIRWKTSIPGRGQSTPIVWGDLIFITTAVPYGEVAAPRAEHSHGAHDNVPAKRSQEFRVIAIERQDGSIAWERTVRRGRPHESAHQSGSWASHSAVTDGQYLIASFGSQGIYGLDLAGRVLWEKDLGDLRIKHGHGEGSSPALAGDSVVVSWDHEDESYVVALDKRTGKERWRTARDEGTSWSTPLIVEHDGRRQVIVAATGRVRAYDLKTGKVVWECGGLSGNVVASPVAADGFVYVANSYESRNLLAIRLEGAKGDITGTDAIVWTRHRDTPYVPSPLLYGDALCFLKHYQGFVTCVEARTGRSLFGPVRLEGIRNVYASPVGAGDRIYIVDRDGTTAVLRRGTAFELIARNRLDDSFAASPAVAGDEIYLRGERNLYCIAEDRDRDSSPSASRPPPRR